MSAGDGKTRFWEKRGWLVRSYEQMPPPCSGVSFTEGPAFPRGEGGESGVPDALTPDEEELASSSGPLYLLATR